MTKVDIFSGFLGAGKTTLIKKLIKEAYKGEMIVVIENEFGKIGIDGGFLKEAGIQITEMNSGCICCSLVGDFGKALAQVKAQYDPDRIVIEPSGVGKLSDVIRAVQDAGVEGLQLNAFTTVIDASKCRMYMKNFAEFYRNQIEFASSVILSRTGGIREDKLKDAVEIVRSLNKDASLITTPWDQLDGRAILETMEKKNTLEAELRHLLDEEKEKDAHHHHHHHHDDDEECDDPECECHHHHDDDDDDDNEHEHHHHHHHDDDDEDGHEHHHHHHHDDDEECDDPECECHNHHDDDDEHEHHHHHHDGHDADEVFTSWGVETSGKYTAAQIEDCLDELMTGRYGMVLRAKGIVDGGSGEWIHFDYVPGEKEIRTGAPDVIGKLCVIGTGLDKAGLRELFRAD
ncbi:MAG: GTP-binding protein [Clostridia bacterium]|nr:GTP-binding protein [Clostridia bacterium]